MCPSLIVIMCWFDVKPSYIGLERSLHVLGSPEAFALWAHVTPSCVWIRRFTRELYHEL